MTVTSAADESGETVRVQRRFEWGIFFLYDDDAPALADHVAGATVTADSQSVSICVRHAQDVEIGEDPFVVTLDVHLRARPPLPNSAVHEAVIDVTSGVIHIGDADDEYDVRLPPGRWRVRILATPEEHAEHVDIWLEPTTTGAS